MQIKVRAFAGFREILGGEMEMDVPEGTTMESLLRSMSLMNHRFSEEAFDPSGKPKDHLLLMVNRKRIDSMEDLQIKLCLGDEVAILPPAAGG